MRYVLPRTLFLALAVASGFVLAGCDDDDDVNSPVAPREPTATATATPSPTATATASPTGSPTAGGPTSGERVGFFGRIRDISGSTLSVGDVNEVVTTGATGFTRDGRNATLADFSVGEFVRVTGTRGENGVINATQITLASE